MSQVATAKQTPAPKRRDRRPLPIKQREFFLTNLQMLLSAAVPIGEAIGAMQASGQGSAFRKSLAQVQIDVDAGSPLWKALEPSGLVSHQSLSLIRLGEESGRLVENLHTAAEQEEKQHMFRSKIRSALIYPGFVLSLTVVIGLAVAWFLLPRLSMTFAELDVELPLVSRLLLGLGEFLQHYGLIAVPIIIGALFLIGYIIFAAPPTKHIGRNLLMRLPGIGRMLREIEVAQFGYLLGSLLQSGIPITQALQSLSEATEDRRYQRFYTSLSHGFEQGYDFKRGITEYAHADTLIPPAIQQMVFAGERSGALPETLENIGRVYEAKAEVSTQNVESVLEPIMLVIVWLGVLLVAVAVILPIYGLIGGLQT